MKYTIINTAVIEAQMYGDKQLLKQFIALYLQQTPKDVEAINYAFTKQDPIAVKSAAHHIKPTLQYIGANELYEQIKELENIAMQLHPWDEIAHSIAVLLPQFDILLKELEHYSTDIT